ncbi:MAG: NAD(P)-dependent oxidoreductase [Dehalococcoidia bacterium]|nr:NAD(P)-dependent oxidoreductase [Dehalococcoidia bacterium]
MKIGFIGLGNMGRHMARHIIQAGYEVIVHDLDELAAEEHLELGAEWAKNPAELAAQSQLIFTSLPGPKEVETVAFGEKGLAEGIKPDTTYVDLSTNSPALSKKLHQDFERLSVEMLDAPVSGGTTGAKDGTLAVLVGGTPEKFELIKEVLATFGDPSRVLHLGSIGSGNIAKLSHNLVSITSGMVLAEAMSLGVKAGVNPAALLEAIQGGAFGRGGAVHFAVPNIVLPGKFDDVQFALELARKDLRLALDLARDVNVPARFCAAAEQEATEGINDGYGKLDQTAAFLVQERRTGVEVRRSE